jgi:hypothetical protein
MSKKFGVRVIYQKIQYKYIIWQLTVTVYHTEEDTRQARIVLLYDTLETATSVLLANVTQSVFMFNSHVLTVDNE